MSRYRALLLMPLLIAACAGQPASQATVPATAAPTQTPSPTAEMHAVSGQVFVISWTYTASTCEVSHSYPDIQAGAEVKLSDEAGTVIAIGTLAVANPNRINAVCVFDFDLGDVPVAKFYTVKVGSRDLTLSYSDLQKDQWKLQLCLRCH